jgi:hypothetical protein
MSSSLEPQLDVRALNVTVTDDVITVELEDGRTITAPTTWYPRLLHATPKERKAYEITPMGIEWPAIEADFSIRGLLLGRKSGEAAESFAYWLQKRREGKRATFADYMEHRRRSKVKKSA